MREKAAIFDVGNVLVSINNEPAVTSFLPFVEPTLDRSTLAATLYPLPSSPTWTGPAHEQFHRGEITAEEFYTIVDTHVHFLPSMNFELFSRMWPNRFTLNHEVIALLSSLSTQQRFILSDTNVLDANWLITHYPEVFRQFDALFFSHERNIDKYSHQAWQNILAVSGLPPQAHVFIDDKPDHVERGRELSIQGIVYTNTDNLKTELGKIGFLKE